MAKRASLISALVTLSVAVIAVSSALAYDPQVETLDAGTVTTFIMNDATFGFDPTFSRVAGTGMYYPGDSYLWVLAGAGIWVGGFRDGEWRVSASGLESDFVPGPYPADGVTFDSLYPIYKINQGDDSGIDDFRNWPVADGAPTNLAGLPLIKGAQALFTVFNDADTSEHVLENFTATLPLGIEVRAYFYTYDNLYQVFDTTLAQVLFVDYEIWNMTDEPIDSCILTLYSDPDIGASRNDRVGSLDSLQAVYAYNDSDVDVSYGDFPPVIGLTLLDNKALSGNFYARCRFNDPSCVVVDTLPEVVNLMKGLRPQGGPYFDPTTSLVTRFPYAGDPVDSVGWLVETSEDYRMIVSTAPRTLLPHQSFALTAAMTVVQGDDVDDGIAKTRSLIASLREFFEPRALTPEVHAASGEAFRIKGRGPSTDNWGGRFLAGGLDQAEYYFSLPQNESKQLPDVTVAFTKSNQYEGLRYVRSGSEYRFAGMVTVPYQSRLLASDEALTVAVLDTAANSFLDLSERFLPLTIVDLPYGEAGPLMNEPISQMSEKLLYVLDLNESVDFMAGTTIEIFGDVFKQQFTVIPPLSNVMLDMQFPAADAFAERSLFLRNTTDFWQDVYAIGIEPAFVSALPGNMQLAPNETGMLFVRAEGFFDETVEDGVQVESTSLVADQRPLEVFLDSPSGLVIGDADANGSLTLDDLLQMIAILYRNAPIRVPIKQLDSDCDRRFDLTDVVLFINYLYRGVEISCQVSSGG